MLNKETRRLLNVAMRTSTQSYLQKRTTLKEYNNSIRNPICNTKNRFSHYVPSLIHTRKFWKTIDLSHTRENIILLDDNGKSAAPENFWNTLNRYFTAAFTKEDHPNTAFPPEISYASWTIRTQKKTKKKLMEIIHTSSQGILSLINKHISTNSGLNGSITTILENITFLASCCITFFNSHCQLVRYQMTGRSIK